MADGMDDPSWLEMVSPETLSLQNTDGDTFLHRVVRAEKPRTALALIDRMPSPILSIQNKYGETPLHLAADKVKLIGNQVILALIAKMEPEAFALQNDHGFTALHRIIDTSDEAEMSLALITAMRPQDLAIRDNYHKTVLHDAIVEEAMAKITNNRAGAQNFEEVGLALAAKMAIDALIDASGLPNQRTILHSHPFPERRCSEEHHP